MLHLNGSGLYYLHWTRLSYNKEKVIVLVLAKLLFSLIKKGMHIFRQVTIQIHTEILDHYL